MGADGNIEPGATIEFWVVYVVNDEEVQEKAQGIEELQFQSGAIQELNLHVGSLN